MIESPSFRFKIFVWDDRPPIADDMYPGKLYQNGIGPSTEVWRDHGQAQLTLIEVGSGICPVLEGVSSSQTSLSNITNLDGASAITCLQCCKGNNVNP
jgi:hypothetical protein